MSLQKMLMDKSETFAKVWEQVLIENPDLDNTIETPVSYYGNLSARDTKEQNNKQLLKKHIREYTLFLVIDNTEMSKSLLAVVLDMARLRGYRVNIVNAENQLETTKIFSIKRLPVLLMVHNETGRIFILTYSLISADKIEERMLRVCVNHS